MFTSSAMAAKAWDTVRSAGGICLRNGNCPKPFDLTQSRLSDQLCICVPRIVAGDV